MLLLQDRKNPYHKCWEQFVEANEFDVNDVQLQKVTENGPKAPSREPAQTVWVTFSATESAVAEIRGKGYNVFHVSDTDQKPMVYVEYNTNRRPEAKLLRSFSTQALDALYIHRG